MMDITIAVLKLVYILNRNSFIDVYNKYRHNNNVYAFINILSQKR